MTEKKPPPPMTKADIEKMYRLGEELIARPDVLEWLKEMAKK